MMKRIEKFSEKGIFHIERDMENQDALVYAEKGSYTAIVLADGVSEFDRSGEGAICAAQAAAKYLTENGSELFSCKTSWIVEQVSDIINDYLHGVSKGKAAIFIQRYFMCFSVDEISENTGRSYNSIVTSLHRMRNELKQKLKNGGVEL